MRPQKRLSPPPGFSSLGLNYLCKDQGNGMMSVDNSSADEPKWERITINVDSGAIDTVGPPEIASAFRVRETPASRNGLTYQSPSGTAIKNEGEKWIRALTGDWTPINFAMQVAAVTKPLGSVYQFCQAGNRVVFDSDGSYIMDKNTGIKTDIVEEKGCYNLHLWVPKGGSKQSSQQGAGIKVSNRFDALSDSVNQDFTRQAALFP